MLRTVAAHWLWNSCPDTVGLERWPAVLKALQAGPVLTKSGTANKRRCICDRRRATPSPGLATDEGEAGSGMRSLGLACVAGGLFRYAQPDASAYRYRLIFRHATLQPPGAAG